MKMTINTSEVLIYANGLHLLGNQFYYENYRLILTAKISNISYDIKFECIRFEISHLHTLKKCKCVMLKFVFNIHVGV